LAVATDVLESRLLALSDELAAAISRRDAEGAACGVRNNEHVAYVSDGLVIRGREYRDVLAGFYASVQGIDFRWEKREVRPIGHTAGVVTGWAVISITDVSGHAHTDKAVFTLVYEKTPLGWDLITAHKTTTAKVD